MIFRPDSKSPSCRNFPSDSEANTTLLSSELSTRNVVRDNGESVRSGKPSRFITSFSPRISIEIVMRGELDKYVPAYDRSLISRLPKTGTGIPRDELKVFVFGLSTVSVMSSASIMLVCSRLLVVLLTVSF